MCGAGKAIWGEHGTTSVESRCGLLVGRRAPLPGLRGHPSRAARGPLRHLLRADGLVRGGPRFPSPLGRSRPLATRGDPAGVGVQRLRPPAAHHLPLDLPRAAPILGLWLRQVLDGTWEAYRDRTGRSSADRDEFEDVVDFIGWYGRVGEERYGIPKTDPYAFYLSYHQGHAGYARGTHPPSARTRSVARRVEAQTQRYGRQYALCRERLDDAVDGPWWWPF